MTKSGQIRKSTWSKSQKQKSGVRIQETGESMAILESWFNGMRGYEGYVFDGFFEPLYSGV